MVWWLLELGRWAPCVGRWSLGAGPGRLSLGTAHLESHRRRLAYVPGSLGALIFDSVDTMDPSVAYATSGA